MKTLNFRLLTVLVLVAHTALSQAQLTDPVPIAPDIKMGKLKNGLTYYIRKNTLPEKKVELRLAVNAGSVLEADDQQGLAHFIEHMGFNGSKHFKKNDLVSFLQSLGVKFGADLNAYTSFDETVYMLSIPLDKKENLDKGLLVLEDWASTVAFADAEVDKERGVVLEESRLGKGATDRMNKVYFPRLLEGSKYAQRLPIGKDDILKNFRYEAVRSFYKDWYRPDLMAVVVVGDIDPVGVERMIKAHFGKLKNPANEKKRPLPEVFARQKTEALVVTDKEAAQSVLQIYYPIIKAKHIVTAGDYREDMIKTLVRSMLATRLGELTQKSDPPFIYGGSGMGGYVRGYEGFNAFALLGKDGPAPALKALVQEDERARKFGFSASELERTKKNMMKGMEQSYNERDKAESDELANELVRNFTTQEVIPGIAGEYNYYKQFLEGISLQEVNTYAANTIPAASGKLVLLTGPEKPPYALPTSDELLAMIGAAEKTDLGAYEENAVATSLIETPPVKGKIISETENKLVGITTITLSNGVTVVVKSTDFRNDQVLMSAFRAGGQSLYGTEDRYNAEYAASLVSQMGVANFSPSDLRKVLAGKSASVMPRISMLSEGLSGQSSADDLETMLQLTYLYLTAPRQDDALFASSNSKQQAYVSGMKSDPQTVFSDSLLKELYSHHPRAPKVPDAKIFSGLSEDRVLSIYRQRFGNSYGLTFIFVGKIDLIKLRPLLETYLGSRASKQVTPAFVDVGVRPVSGTHNLKVYLGAETKSLVSMRWYGEAPYSEAEQLKLQALLEVFNIKVIEKLREEMSGVYSASFSGSLNKKPYNNYFIGINLPCGPENVDKLLKATQDEIQKAKTTGPLESDLNKVKENWKKQYAENMKENSFWLRQLQQTLENGSDAAAILDYVKAVDALTVNDLKAAANKYFDGKNFFEAILYPAR